MLNFENYLLDGFIVFIVPILFISASVSSVPVKIDQSSGDTSVFYITGHRGARGLMPESTIPAMEKGIEVGANTLETDLKITKDGKVVLNHDDTFNPNYVTKPDGSDIPVLPDGKRNGASFIPKYKQDKYAIYKLNYDEIRRYILGERFYPMFPEQKKMETYMPLLTEMIDSVESFTQKHHYAPVYYMPEIKSNPKDYGKYQPYPKEFVKIVMDALKPYMKAIGNRIIIQCSDIKPLQILHHDYPKIKLALLPNREKLTIMGRIKQLGFKPDFFLPRYKIVTSELVKKCHSMHIKIIPWTPDDPREMSMLIQMGVDGIITNYPDRLSRVYENMKAKHVLKK